MGSLIAKISMLVAYVLMIVAVTILLRKRTKTYDDFLLGGRKISGWLSAFSYGTAYFSAVIFVGYAGQFGKAFGAAALFIGLGNGILGCLIPWLLLGKKTRSVTKNLDAHTLPEFLSKRFEDKPARLLASIVIFIFIIPYSASVYQGISELFVIVFNIQANLGPVIVISLAVLTALYLTVGGYVTSTITDFIQGLIMLAGVTFMMIFLFKNSNVGGIENAFINLENAGKGLNLTGTDKIVNLIFIILLTSLGSWGLPQMMHKFYAMKEGKKSLIQAVIISTFFCVFIGTAAYLSGSLAYFFLDSTEYLGGAIHKDSIVPIMLSRAFGGSIGGSLLLGLITVLLLSASMSTLSALSLTSGSIIVNDMVKGYIKKDTNDNKMKSLLQLLCIGVILASALIAIFKPAGIVELMSLSWGTISSCFIGPYVYGVLWKKTTKAAMRTSIILGLFINLFFVFIMPLIVKDNAFLNNWLIGMKNAPKIGVIAMFLSLIVTPLVSLFTKPASKEVIEQAFQKH